MPRFWLPVRGVRFYGNAAPKNSAKKNAKKEVHAVPKKHLASTKTKKHFDLSFDFLCWKPIELLCHLNERVNYLFHGSEHEFEHGSKHEFASV